MTWHFASMLTTRKQISADILTAPAIFVVGFPTQFSGRLFAAEAGLLRAHKPTRWARSGMALKRTWVRARRARLGTRLSAGMRRQGETGRLGADFFATPAVISPWIVGKFRIAGRAAPRALDLHLCRLRFLLLHLVAVPFLGALHVNHSPAECARPDVRSAEDFVCADCAFIVGIANIFMDARRQISRCGLWQLGPRLLRTRWGRLCHFAMVGVSKILPKIS